MLQKTLLMSIKKSRKEIKKMRKETKNGVMYTFEENGFANEAVDVEVQPGIECLILQYGLNMPESEK